MADAEKARELFQKAGLTFPNIPEDLAEQLEENNNWLFSTREIKVSPYNLEHYVCESNAGDYLILSHSGHGVNSYAIQYYLVYKALRMFLHLGWGGVYMNAKKEATKINDCFSLANGIIPAMQKDGRVQADDWLTIVGSDFYGSYWVLPGENRRYGPEGTEGPTVVLAEVLNWLKSDAG
jgi:hypothetical protein